MKLTPEFATRFAQEWVHAWNSHDLELILSHYSSSISFYSPFVSQIGYGNDGMIDDPAVLRNYFARALNLYPDLYFDFHEVLTGTDTVVIYYTSIKNLSAAEMMQFDANGKVIQVRAHYKLS